MKFRYFEEDEAEILIQVLSFGTIFKVISPEDFIHKLRSRILRQKELCKKF